MGTSKPMRMAEIVGIPAMPVEQSHSEHDCEEIHAPLVAEPTTLPLYQGYSKTSGVAGWWLPLVEYPPDIEVCLSVSKAFYWLTGLALSNLQVKLESGRNEMDALLATELGELLTTKYAQSKKLAVVVIVVSIYELALMCSAVERLCADMDHLFEPESIANKKLTDYNKQMFHAEFLHVRSAIEAVIDELCVGLLGRETAAIGAEVSQ